MCSEGRIQNAADARLDRRRLRLRRGLSERSLNGRSPPEPAAERAYDQEQSGRRPGQPCGQPDVISSRNGAFDDRFERSSRVRMAGDPLSGRKADHLPCGPATTVRSGHRTLRSGTILRPAGRRAGRGGGRTAPDRMRVPQQVPAATARSVTVQIVRGVNEGAGGPAEHLRHFVFVLHCTMLM